MYVISTNPCSSHISPSVQMVTLRLREKPYIAEGHKAEKYLSCGCAKGLDLNFSGWSNLKIMSNIPRLKLDEIFHLPISLGLFSYSFLL